MSNFDICSVICRAKRIDNGEWANGFFMFDECCLIAEDLRVTHDRTVFPNIHPVNYETICKSTGKHDKNNNLIFEGDIISWFGCQKYIVRYGEFHGTVGLGYYYGLGFYIERIGDPTHRVPFNTIDCDKKEYEVIGNIYDSKDLLTTETI